MREHVTSDVRIHYTITDGGVAPNIVPDKASVWYYTRALSREAVESTYERLVKVAKGAAMMTETEV
ncbi:peptidase dimerization domain-containing protein, partial [Clostridioides difficile]|uniref:peptidase dimerization domain-containing protein n=1 Tax=Clostridioides difficile TaxID=1496 RepID=UPI00254E22C9